MKIYIYDKISGEYTGEQNAQPNPKRAGEFLYPANSTTKTPPMFKHNETIVFKNDQWNIVKDYRGQEIVNIATKDISIVQSIGDIEKGYVLNSDYVKSDDYKKYLQKQEKQNKKSDILSKLVELDLKRIRAVCEPSVKDETTGQTWIEYYTSQVKDLRKQLEEF